MAKGDKVPRSEALRASERLKAAILSILPGTRVEFAGSLRREEDVVGDIDLLYEGRLANLRSVPGLTWVRGGDSKGTMVWEGRQVDVWRIEPNEWGSQLFWLTGPVQYNIAYARRAKGMGMHLSGHGLFRGAERIAGEDEEGIFRALGKQWKHPNLRGR